MRRLPNEGKAMTLNFYDTVENKSVDLGIYNLKGGMYLRAAPPERPGFHQGVYVDRFFLVKE